VTARGKTKKRAFWAHATAVVDAGARVGAGTKIWHFCHVMAGARVGARCVLGQNVFLASGAVVGDGCRVQNNVSIFDGVVLEDEVFVGPSAVFTNVKTPRAAVNRKAAFVATRVGRGATIGANATVVCGTIVGAYAFVGAGAVVTADVPAHVLVTGVPARRTGWACVCGETLRQLPLGRLACAPCGRSYRTDDACGGLLAEAQAASRRVR
jgi:UDP-2-acetamido-3-amino-2,3-dideoxy-glucuronate N-acetyltransferase